MKKICLFNLSNNIHIYLITRQLVIKIPNATPSLTMQKVGMFRLHLTILNTTRTRFVFLYLDRTLSNSHLFRVYPLDTLKICVVFTGYKIDPLDQFNRSRSEHFLFSQIETNTFGQARFEAIVIGYVLHGWLSWLGNVLCFVGLNFFLAS